VRLGPEASGLGSLFPRHVDCGVTPRWFRGRLLAVLRVALAQIILGFVKRPDLDAALHPIDGLQECPLRGGKRSVVSVIAEISITVRHFPAAAKNPNAGFGNDDVPGLERGIVGVRHCRGCRRPAGAACIGSLAECECIWQRRVRLTVVGHRIGYRCISIAAFEDFGRCSRTQGATELPRLRARPLRTEREVVSVARAHAVGSFLACTARARRDRYFQLRWRRGFARVTPFLEPEGQRFIAQCGPTRGSKSDNQRRQADTDDDTSSPPGRTGWSENWQYRAHRGHAPESSVGSRAGEDRNRTRVGCRLGAVTLRRQAGVGGRTWLSYLQTTVISFSASARVL